jgi:hypothetical protein
MFNPEEYTLSRDNNFASQAIPGLSSPLLQFVHGNLRTLEMELFFDTFEQRRDVREVTQPVVGLLDIDRAPCAAGAPRGVGVAAVPLRARGRARSSSSSCPTAAPRARRFP